MIGRAAPIIGLDLGSARLKAFQPAPRGATGPDAAPASLELPRLRVGGPPDSEEARRLAEVMQRRGFVGRRCVIAAPASVTRVTPLELPPAASGAPLAALARAELTRLTGADPGGGGIELAYWPVPRAPSGPSDGPVLAVGLPTEQAEAWLSPLDEAGLEVVAIDAAPLAIGRALHPRAGPSGDGPRLWVCADIGHEALGIVAFHGAIPFYARRLPELGLGALLASWSGRVGVGVAWLPRLLCRGALPELTPCLQAFARDLRAECEVTARFAAGHYPGVPLDPWRWVGGGARVLEGALAGTDAPGPRAGADGVAMALAVGLSRRDQGPMPSLTGREAAA